MLGNSNSYEMVDGIVSQIMNCASLVYFQLGGGYPVDIYQKALTIELERAQLTFVIGQEYPVFYDGDLLIGKRKVEFVVENMVTINIQTNNQLLPIDHQHVHQYLTAFHFDAGVVINFGEIEVEFKQFSNNTIKTLMEVA